MRDIQECDEFPGPMPELGTYWEEHTMGIVQVVECFFDSKEVGIQVMPDGEEMYELLEVFCAIYNPVSEEELPLHLLGLV